MPKVKITVVKTSTEDELFEEYAHEKCKRKCHKHEEGEEFIVNPKNFFVPEDLCADAWEAISNKVFTLMHGGNFKEWNWIKNENIAIACCNDGIRPVFFKIEPIG